MTAMLGSGTTTQMNAITASVQAGFGVSTYITCAVITVLVAIITFGGLKSISKTASKIVPAMAVVYFIVTVIFLGLNAGELPHAIALVIDGAFNGTERPAASQAPASCSSFEAVSPAACTRMSPVSALRRS